MPRLPTTSSLARPRAHPGLGLGAGLLTAALVVGLDVAAGADTIITTALILAPFVAALLGSPRETLAVSVVATGLAALSGAWNANFGESNYFLRLAIVTAGDAVAIVAATGRAHEEATRERFRVLMEAARVVDDTLSLEEAVERLGNLIVPAFADLCIFDLNRGAGLERLKVRASGPRATQLEQLLQDRGPPARNAGGIGAAESPRVHLIERVSGEHLGDLSHEDSDMELSRTLDATSGLAVPLRARGRNLGLVTLAVTGHSGRRYGPGDLEFAELLGGRAGLALDNAGLFTELTSAEAQLTAVLGSLAEAVTVQSAAGGLIYANDAAAEVLGFETPERLLATPPAEIVDRFESYHEDGTGAGAGRLVWRLDAQ